MAKQSSKQKKSGRPKNCGRCNKAKKQCKCGRPTVMTKEVLDKLREAFLIGCTDREACLVADISPAALYKYCDENPEYKEQKELWKDQPKISAKKNVVDAIERKKEIGTSQWYLERKSKKEFSSRQEVSGPDGGPIKHKDVSEKRKKAIDGILKENNEAEKEPT